MKKLQAKIRNHGTAIICLLLGTIAPALHAQAVQYAKPENNAMQAQPHQTAHYYTAKSNVPSDASAIQLTCPRGTHRNSQGHCVTIPRNPPRHQAPSHAHIYTAHSNVPPNTSAVQPTCPHGMFRNSQGRCVTVPRDPSHTPGPTKHHANASNTHGIIFVGGKNKAALNPQPIPPGHALRKPPPPNAPIEKPAGH